MRSRLCRFIGLDEILNEPKPFVRALVAELVATTILLTVGMGSGLPSTTNSYTPNTFESSIGGGLTVVGAVQMSFAVSGAHLNPAVTVAMLVAGKTKAFRAVFYIAVQIVAGFVSAWFLVLVQPNSVVEDLLARPGAMLTDGQVFAVEFVATLGLILPACTIAEKKAAPVKGTEPLIMGLTVVACHLFALKFSGCGLNPARILGPALLANKWKNIWIYCCAEFSAGVIGSLVYFFAMAERPEKVPTRRTSDSLQIFPRTISVEQSSPKTSFIM